MAIENHLTFLGCGTEELQTIFAENRNRVGTWCPKIKDLES